MDHFDVDQMISATAVCLKLPAATPRSISRGSSWSCGGNDKHQLLLLPSGLVMGDPFTWSGESWMCAGMVEAGSSWWTGRFTVQKSSPSHSGPGAPTNLLQGPF